MVTHHDLDIRFINVSVYNYSYSWHLYCDPVHRQFGYKSTYIDLPCEGNF